MLEALVGLGIYELVAVGALAGLFIGLAIHRLGSGCAALFIVPIIMIVAIKQWQNTHPENLRSTSALDFMFGPLWPSIGAIAGYFAGRILREAWLSRQNRRS